MTSSEVLPDSLPVSVAEASSRTPLGATAAISVKTDGLGGAIAHVTGELDLACADRLTVALCAALDAHPTGLLLDLSGVEFFDCAALHAIEGARRHAEALSRPLAVGGASTVVERVFGLVEHLNRCGRPGKEPGDCSQTWSTRAGHE